MLLDFVGLMLMKMLLLVEWDAMLMKLTWNLDEMQNEIANETCMWMLTGLDWMLVCKLFRALAKCIGLNCFAWIDHGHEIVHGVWIGIY